MQIVNVSVKKDGRKNNPIKSSTKKKDERIQCCYSMSTMRAFDVTKTRHGLCRGKDCMKNFYTSLEDHAMQRTNFENK